MKNVGFKVGLNPDFTVYKLNKIFFSFFQDDVAVIDEIQMLSNSSRGYAWTRAFLGVAAKEVHLCGEESALNFIKNMAEKLGEKFEVILNIK